MNNISPAFPYRAETIHPRFENIIDNLREDIETKNWELEELIHNGLNSAVRVNFILEQIDELQDTLDELTT